jgi:hypothetical protein
MQQLLMTQPALPAAAVAARLVAVIASLAPDSRVPQQLLPAFGAACASPSAAGASNVEAGAAAVSDKQRLRVLLLLLDAFAAAPLQCPPLVACLGQQVVLWLQHASSPGELMPLVLRAALLALTAATCSTAQEPRSTALHMAVWQQAQDIMQVCVVCAVLCIGGSCWWGRVRVLLTPVCLLCCRWAGHSQHLQRRLVRRGALLCPAGSNVSRVADAHPPHGLGRQRGRHCSCSPHAGRVRQQ